MQVSNNQNIFSSWHGVLNTKLTPKVKPKKMNKAENEDNQIKDR